ncbi:hypothetical protein [Streptomyces albogriseolus]|uniref:hypothetical protein n=1 Tax=Streptomyces albogriseolus TaxID=1887 RepID=UPI003CF44C93
MTDPTTDRPHLDVIASALEDWWLLTDPARPFDINVVAQAVDARLTRSGYQITPTTRTPPMPTHRPTPPPPSRAALAFALFLTLSCLTGATIALIRGDWWWVAAGAFGAVLLGHECIDEITTRRAYTSRNHP